MTKAITIVAIDYEHHDLTRFAIEQTMKCVDVKDVVTISDKEIMPGARSVITRPVHDMKEYNLIMLKGVANLVNTSHALYVQWDGFAHQKSRWDNDFLNYDYIGAVWPNEPEGYNVGNGGFSLRSKKLLDACLDPEIQLLPKYNMTQEDACIGRDFRPLLESRYNIKFAPTTTALQFSHELGPYHNTFAFHGIWNVLGFCKRETTDRYIAELTWNNWDQHKWHHVINALWQRQHLDLVTLAISKLRENQPNLVSPIELMIMQHQQYLKDGDKLLAMLQG